MEKGAQSAHALQQMFAITSMLCISPVSSSSGQTQRRKGAKTQAFRFLGSFARHRDRIMQREEKPGQILMILSCHDSVCLAAAVPHCVLASLRLCVNCPSWVQAASCRGHHHPLAGPGTEPADNAPNNNSGENVNPPNQEQLSLRLVILNTILLSYG